MRHRDAGSRRRRHRDDRDRRDAAGTERRDDRRHRGDRRRRDAEHRGAEHRDAGPADAGCCRASGADPCPAPRRRGCCRDAGRRDAGPCPAPRRTGCCPDERHRDAAARWGRAWERRHRGSGPRSRASAPTTGSPRARRAWLRGWWPPELRARGRALPGWMPREPEQRPERRVLRAWRDRGWGPRDGRRGSPRGARVRGARRHPDERRHRDEPRACRAWHPRNRTRSPPPVRRGACAPRGARWSTKDS